MKTKLFTGALAALISFAALGATTSPVQLLNPSGSASGQAVISNGPSLPPTWGTVGIAGGGTGATSAATARSNLGLGSIATQSAGAVSVTGGAMSGVAISGGTLSGASITNAPITGNAGSFTTLSSSGLYTPVSTVGIKGTTTNDGTAAGSWGEYLTNSASGTSMASGTPGACASITLTAGDWDVTGQVTFVPAATTTIGSLQSGINTSIASTTGPNGLFQTLTNTFSAGTVQQLATPLVRESLATTTTIYLIGQSAFGTSTMTCNGFIRARRVR